MQQRSVSSKRFLAFVSVSAVLTVVSAVFVARNDYWIFPPGNPHTPVVEWSEIGFDRRNLEDSRKTISKAEYEKKKSALLASEDEIARRYPRRVDYKAYYSIVPKRPGAYWIALTVTLITGLATVSGVLLAWRNDRRTAIETDVKIEKLGRDLEGPESPRIVVP